MENQDIKFAKCRRGSDPVTAGQSCDGNQVINLSLNSGHVASPVVKLQCVKCKYVWSVQTGGHVEL